MLKPSFQLESSGTIIRSNYGKKGYPGFLWHYPPQAYWQTINGSNHCTLLCIAIFCSKLWKAIALLLILLEVRIEMTIL